jgi:hypothetical protein
MNEENDHLNELLMIIGLEIYKHNKNVYLSDDTLMHLYELIEIELINREEVVIH